GQYKEVFDQEYHSTNVPQTLAFFKENLQEDDFIVYNWELFGFIYECYWSEEQLAYVEDFDFFRDFRVVWFIDTKYQPDIGQKITENGLHMEPVRGNFGIEHNQFDIYKIYR
ncbi:MAG: hypothetical protein LBI54_02835, partial [Lachnospiraceae bacterium]|nr:hypothetical protein [Lachnospiraceae bacterium]